MSNNTISGEYCSPIRSRDVKDSGVLSCYTKKQMLSLAQIYNSQYTDSITLTGSKSDLWGKIDNKMTKCSNEWCWSDTLKYSHGLSSFRPIRPVGKNAWLSTLDIKHVLQQYQELYSDFIAMGPVPIDFCNIGYTICDMNVIKAYKKGARTIGIVFNTDPSTAPGKHWISMFIDMRSPDPLFWEINYFDSFGNSSLPSEIKRLVNNVEKQFRAFTAQFHTIQPSEAKVIKKLNCSRSICTHSIQYQFNNTECGVFSIHFIVQRLIWKTWEELVKERASILNDKYMTDMRKFYFRPTVGDHHRY
uniref:Ubiquitin-like protease family profile domain-containing protein n=1 Tax=viral metagenome TaxID=1070528 RepID=A0A6C0J5G8_9ZZZZ